MKRHIFLLSLLVLICSCASSRRLARVFNEKTDNTSKEADRTNMFPLFYVSGTSTSFLWPLIDSDDRGLSIRPIYNQEDDEFAVLFPLSAWNPVDNEGWIGPYYWNKEHSALFPLYYRDEHHTQFLNYYSHPTGSMLFPLYLHFEDSNEKGFYTLLGGYSQHGDRSNSMAGLLWWSGSAPGESYKTLFPIFYHGVDEHDQTLYFFPWLSHKGKLEQSSMLFPLFYQDSNQQGDYSFYTLLGGHSKRGDQSNTMVTPLWWSGSSPKKSYKTLLPIYHQSESDNVSSLYLFPWYHKTGKNTKNCFIFPLFRSSKRFSDDGELTRDQWNFPMILPLAEKENTATGTRTSALLGALFEHESKGDKSEGDVLIFLADWENSPTTHKFRFPALFNLRGLFEVSKDEEKSKVNFLLYSHEKTEKSVRRDIFPFITWDSGENESGFSFLWRVFETHNRDGKKGGHIFFIPYGA